MVDKLRSELSAVADEVAHMGDVGAGMVAKILNNFIVTANAEVLREAFSAANDQGLDLEQFQSVLTRTTGRSWVVEHWDAVRIIVEPTSFEDGLMSRKDVNLAATLPRRVDGMFFLASLREFLQQLAEEFEHTNTI